MNVSGEPIIIPPDDTATEAEKHIYGHPENAKLRVFYEGKFFPVCRMFGAEGQIVTNPLHAFACIAFTEQWAILSCKPGDIEPIREGRPWL